MRLRQAGEERADEMRRASSGRDGEESHDRIALVGHGAGAALDDALALRLARVLAGEIGIARRETVVAEKGAGQLRQGLGNGNRKLRGVRFRELP
jgi:hypothetical protein